MQQQSEKAEEQALIARHGPTVQRTSRFELDDCGYNYWLQAQARLRRAEVVMIVQRPDGQLLLHTKTHHPPGTYRLPTGGVLWGERVLDALEREQWEELGVRLPVASMPGIIHYILHHPQWTIPFTSFLFILPTAAEFVPVAHDPTEAISDFCWIPPEEIQRVADQLRGVSHIWADWGPFRAVAHDLLAEIWGLPGFRSE